MLFRFFRSVERARQKRISQVSHAKTKLPNRLSGGLIWPIHDDCSLTWLLQSSEHKDQILELSTSPKKA